MEDWLTVEEAANYLKIPRHSSSVPARWHQGLIELTECKCIFRQFPVTSPDPTVKTQTGDCDVHRTGFACLMAMVLVFWVFPCSGQQLSPRMKNQDVIDMVSLGLSDDVVIEKIHATQATDFDTSVAALRVLKAAKVSDAVIRAMINPHPAASGTDKTPVASGTENTPPQEVGVYVVLNGKLTEIEPEIVNWQSGGVVKHVSTFGIVKEDRNGKVLKGKSHTQTTGPLEFLIRTMEGTSVEEYQLLRLHEKNDRREFRSMTGGVFHLSGGAQRDEIEFQPEKIGIRTWKITLRDLPKGEYGFLPPGIESASISASGKMYTFGVIEGSNAQHQNVSEKQTAATASTNSDKGPQIFKEASIGVFSDLNPNVRRDGITVNSVTAGGPADQVGIKAGDAILSIDDHYLFTVAELKEQVSHYQPGTKITVRYRRYSTIYDTSVVVGRGQ